MDEEELVDYEADEEEYDDDPQPQLPDSTTNPSSPSSVERHGESIEKPTEDETVELNSSSSGGVESQSKRAADTLSLDHHRKGYNVEHGDDHMKKRRLSVKQVGASSSGGAMIHAETTGFGVYIPPFRRRQLEQQQDQVGTDSKNKPTTTPPNPRPTSSQTQRLKWEQLKKTINGTINRLNSSTIKPLIHSLLQNGNLIRGKGLLAKSILRAATTSPTYSQVYVALVSVINTKLPEIGELVLTRSILVFRKAYARQDKGLAVSMSRFIGHLFNQGMCHELLCLQILTVLLEGDPTDDSVEVATQFTEVVGMALMESSPAGVHAIMERFRNLLHDGTIGRRVQYKVEELIVKRRKRFKMCPSVEEDLDLVEREEQIMFEITLDDDGLKREEVLDVFQFDEKWEDNENSWIEIQKEILGEDDDSSNDGSSDDEDGENPTDEEEGDNDTRSGSDNEDDNMDDGDDGQLQLTTTNADSKLVTVIHDMSEKDLTQLRRTIYLTIMSSATFEECTHKLTKVDIPTGKEVELINMIIECCSQERTFLRYYGLISGRFCLLHSRWRIAFEESFTEQYETIHRLGTNKLRNVAKLFAHLLHTDSLPWSCISSIHLNEDETTSSSRIFLKILVQEMAGAMGIANLVTRFETSDPVANGWYSELFPKNKPRNTRYAINFFTSIGLGPLTDGLREHLKNAPKLIKLQVAERAKKKEEDRNRSDDSDDSSSVSSSVRSTSTSTFGSSSVSSSSSTDSSSSTYTHSSSCSSSYTSGSSSDESSVSYRRKKKVGATKSRKKFSSGRKRTRSNSNSSSSSVSSYHRHRKGSMPFTSNERSKSRQDRSNSRSRSRSRSVPTEIHESQGRELDRKDNRTEQKERNGQNKHKQRSRSYSSYSSSSSK